MGINDPPEGREPNGNRSPKPGDRVVINSGDLYQETGVILSGPSGQMDLYAIRLDSDGTFVQCAASRFSVIS